MALDILTFDPNKVKYKVAILIKNRAMKHKDVLQNYVEPLIGRGLRSYEIMAISLQYNEQDKAPVRLIKEHLQAVEKVLSKYNIKHVLCADAAYFKTLCKVKKAEPHYGYVLPTILPGVQASLTLNYQSLFYNPSLGQRLMLGVEALVRDIYGDEALFKTDIFGDIEFPTTEEEIQQTLQKLLQYTKLTCDIETHCLHLNKGRIVSISFAWNQKDGVAFLTHHMMVPKLLKNFFEEYTGTLIFHNATFDIGRLITNLFMDHPRDMKGMLEGLHCLYRDIEDTQILAYLSLNSTAGNKLSLKELAFEYTGNYALDSMDHIQDLDRETLLRYNLTDTLATWFVFEKYRNFVEKTQKEQYQNLFKPALKVITQMELCGIPLNKNSVESTEKELESIRSVYESKIFKNNLIKTFEKELKLEAVLDANSKLKKKRKDLSDFEDLQFNPRSSKQLRSLLYEKLDLPVLRHTDTGLASTDGKTLTALIQHLKTTYNL